MYWSRDDVSYTMHGSINYNSTLVAYFMDGGIVIILVAFLILLIYGIIVTQLCICDIDSHGIVTLY
jgi:hypothetical protein